jgi:hypothetical protein
MPDGLIVLFLATAVVASILCILWIVYVVVTPHDEAEESLAEEHRCNPEDPGDPAQLTCHACLRAQEEEKQ